MATRKEYNDSETRALCDAYVSMAVAQFAGDRVNKAALVRTLQAGALAGRTRGAIEAKFMNISAHAVRSDLLPMLPGGYVKGYKPAPNGAKALHDALIIAIYRSREAHAMFNAYAATGGDVAHVTVAL